MLLNDNYSHVDPADDSTGAPLGSEKHKLVVVPFERYDVVVCLSEDERFLGIAELRVRKDFLSPEQRVATSRVLDVEEFYEE